MKQTLLIVPLIVSCVVIECSSTSVASGSCSNEPCTDGHTIDAINDGSLSMLQMGMHAAKAKSHDVSMQEPIDHVKGVSKDKTPWLHSDKWYVNKTALIDGYQRLDGDCPWNNLKVSEKTSLEECASLCDGDCRCLGFSWAKDWGGRCITKSKTCKSKEVWKNIWTFYVKLPAKQCNAAKCSAWGDPHYTATFYGGKPDVMSKGLFKIASTVDNAFQLQGFQGPLGWGAAFSAFAMSVDGTRLTIVGKDVRIDGHMLDNDTGIPSWLRISDDNTVSVESADLGVSFKSIYKTSKMSIGPGYYHNMNLAISESAASFEGACGSSKSPQPPVRRDDALFSNERLDLLCKATGTTNCFEDVAPKTAEEICKDEGVSYDDAVAKCQSLKGDEAFFKACTFDYCASDGDEDMAADAVQSKEDEDDFVVVPTTPAPPVKLIGCFKDTWDRDLTFKAGMSMYPAECQTMCSAYKYSAIQAGVECWCGNDYGKHGEADDCECDNPEWEGKGFRSCIYGEPK